MNAKKKIFFGLLLSSVLSVVVFAAPLRWIATSTYRRIFPEQTPERPVYNDTRTAPLDLSEFVSKARVAWPNANPVTVNHAAIEVALGLLHHPDIEVGSRVGGVFVPWRMSAWNAGIKVTHELSERSDFLAEDGRYVFRRR